MNTLVVPTHVVAAEVYRRGCSVTYRGMAELVEGANRLVVESLPEGLDDGSISLRLPPVVAQGQIKVVSEREAYLDEAPDEPTELEKQLAELDRRIANKELELDAWKGLASKIGGNTALEYLALYPTKLDDLSSELLRLREERRVLARQCDDEQEKSARPHLEIDVSSPQAGAMPLELVCRSDEAGWMPEYDVLVDDTSAPLRLRMKASVWQRTGDDWRDVALRLGTGTAAVLGDLPRFVPRYLYKAENTPRVQKRERGMTFGARMSVYEVADAMEELASPSGAMAPAAAYDFDDVVELPDPDVEVVEQATTTSYELDDVQTLATGGESQLFVLSTSELAARYYLYAYPRRDEAAYLVAHLDTEPAPEVLERPLSVYIEGSYAGTIRIGRATDEYGYELPLGRDNRIRVHRKEDVKWSGKFLRGKVMVDHSCSIAVESHAKSAMSIVVVEQVPVSRDKAIEVLLGDSHGATFDADRGELRWERTLEPGERLALSATYTISHPKGQALGESTQ